MSQSRATNFLGWKTQGALLPFGRHFPGCRTCAALVHQEGYHHRRCCFSRIDVDLMNVSIADPRTCSCQRFRSALGSSWASHLAGPLFLRRFLDCFAKHQHISTALHPLSWWSFVTRKSCEALEDLENPGQASTMRSRAGYFQGDYNDTADDGCGCLWAWRDGRPAIITRCCEALELIARCFEPVSLLCTHCFPHRHHVVADAAQCR